jgi:hypothetical protein
MSQLQETLLCHRLDKKAPNWESVNGNPPQRVTGAAHGTMQKEFRLECIALENKLTIQKVFEP